MLNSSTPSTIPMPRYSSRDGMPSFRDSRTAINANSRINDAIPNAPSGVFTFNDGSPGPCPAR